MNTIQHWRFARTILNIINNNTQLLYKFGDSRNSTIVMAIRDHNYLQFTIIKKRRLALIDNNKNSGLALRGKDCGCFGWPSAVLILISVLICPDDQ